MGEGDFPFLDPVFPPPGTSFSQFYTGLLGLEERRVEGARVRSRVRGWGGWLKPRERGQGSRGRRRGPVYSHLAAAGAQQVLSPN